MLFASTLVLNLRYICLCRNNFDTNIPSSCRGGCVLYFRCWAGPNRVGVSILHALSYVYIYVSTLLTTDSDPVTEKIKIMLNVIHYVICTCSAATVESDV